MAKKKKISKKEKPKEKVRFNLTIFITFCIGVLLIFATYAWFSTSLNVQIKNFNMIVTKNSGLTISFDAINYDSFVEISEDSLINNLKTTYPTNISQWSNNGLIPVSTIGINNPNDYRFDIYATSGVRYKNKKRENGTIYTSKVSEVAPNSFNYYIAFDLFFKNETGSPISDNLYLDQGTEVIMESNSTEEMEGLVNSIRIGFVKIGSVPLNTAVDTIQNLGCNNNCTQTIFEPNSRFHTPLSIERSRKYGIRLVNGNMFPTYANIREGGPILVKDTVSGTANLNTNYFALQNTITEDDFGDPLFEIPNGVTKARVYVWIEGQDIDSLETDSEGADISISINFVKDTEGYDTFN